MTKKEVKKRIEKLKKLINHYRYLYHVLDSSEISDAAWDSLKKELFDLENKYPEFITPDSPTQRVGGKPLAKFEKFKHPQKMLSFNDAFSEKDMGDWRERNFKLLTQEERKKVNYYCELKIDGLAVELIYNKGSLKVGSTRGDGLTGENVTQNLKTIEAIPLKIRDLDEIITDLKKEGLKEIAENIKRKGLKKVIVRGEVFCSKKEFERINKEQKKKGLSKFANPRNMTAGSVRQLDPKITASRKLDSFEYDLITDFGQKTHEEKHKILKTLGFKTNSHNKFCKNLKEVIEFRKDCQQKREKLNYEIDGIVVQINQNRIFEKLGVVGKAPRAAIAFKFPLKQSTTKVENVIFQVGRSGAITPVAILSPVEVGGVTISRATLHNDDEIKKLGIKIGDTVIVGRAGDVIPDVIKTLPELRTGKEKSIHFPKNCPVCNKKLYKPEKEVVWRCVNSKCPARKREYFYHFISKNAFDIDGLGPKIIDRLIDESLVSDPRDLFELKEGDILPLERFAEKSTKNLIESIQSKKKITLHRFIISLGIRNVGEETAQDLAECLGSLNRIKKASLEELKNISDIGPIVAQSIFNWFQEKRNLDFLKRLEKSGIKIIAEKKKKHQPLKGKIFVLTGGLEIMTRDRAKNKIRMLGGEISESVSNKTDYVVVGKEPGLKYEKAKELGVKIINEKEFLNFIKKF